jgi:ankyrin repeat protein
MSSELTSTSFLARNDSTIGEIDKLIFHNACAKGNLTVVKNYLVQQGCDMYISDIGGRTGFHLACFTGDLKVVQFFLQQGFDMYIGDNGGRTGFHLACFMGNLNVVQFLLQEGGFDMYLGNNAGNTGFHAACFMGNLNVVQFLVQRGFDINVSGRSGLTGFHVACLGGKLNPFLNQRGFNIPDDIYHEKIRFHIHGNLNVVQFLLQQGFDMNCVENNGVTGFHFACVSGNLNVVQFLLQQGFFNKDLISIFVLIEN